MMRIPTAAWALVIGFLSLNPQLTGAADWLLPHTPQQIRVRMDITVDGQAAEVNWQAFLDNWFAYFDRDSNNQLDQHEIRQVLPLPDAKGSSITPQLKDCDADGNGQASPSEMKGFYQRAGFTAVVTQLAPPRAADDALSAVLFRELDLDRSGALTKGELAQATQLLRRFDEDEDEALTENELLATSQSPSTPPQSTNPGAVAPESDGSAPQATIKLAITADPPSPVFSFADASQSLFAVEAARQGQPMRIRMGANYCTIATERPVKQQLFKQVRSFYVAQFRTAFGATTPVTQDLFQRDATLKSIAEQFNVAERDGDGKLSLQELTTFLSLIEQGVGSQVTAVLSTHGRNLFDALDRNHDTRIDYRELRHASQILPADLPEAGLTREQIPIQFQLRVERGSPGTSFATIPIPNRTRNSTDSTVESAEPGAAPKWFRALDRNGDRTITINEFPANPKQFLTLDSDADGAITLEEATRP